PPRASWTVLQHADASLPPPYRSSPSSAFRLTPWPPRSTIVTALPPLPSGRLSLTVAFCRHSNPIAHRVRRSRYEVSCWGRLRSRLATMRPESCPLSARSRVDEEEAAYPLEETSAQRASAGAS